MLSGPRRSRSDHYHLTSVLCEIPIIWRSSPSSLRCRWPSLDGRVFTLWVRWFGQETNRKPSAALTALSVFKSSGSHCRQRRRLLPGDQVVRAHRNHQIRSPPAPGAEQLFPREAILYKRLSVGLRRRQRRGLVQLRPSRIVAQVVKVVKVASRLYNTPIYTPVGTCDDRLDLQMIRISQRMFAR